MNHHRGDFFFFMPLNGWLSKLFVSFLCGKKHHLPGTARCSKQNAKKIQFDLSLEAIWFPAALVSHHVRASPSYLNSLDGISWCAAQSRRTWAQCWYDAAVLRQNSVALSLIETSRRPISTDGCHMYANKEQSESRSPISTTCPPHTASPKKPLQSPRTHTRTHTHTDVHATHPPNPFGGTSLFFSIHSCTIKGVKKLTWH